jgi:hypothetical protein
VSPNYPPRVSKMSLPVRKGLDFTPSQWIAAFAGFFASAGLASILGAQGSVSRNWATVMVILGFGLPPTIVGWFAKRKRDVS